jgi:hypothetical protein
MSYLRIILVGVLLLGVVAGWGQETIKPENVATLNRIAEEYDRWKWIFGISVIVVAAITFVWNLLGFKTILQHKVNDWLDDKISKETGLKIESVKAALSEYARNAELKKKRILIVSGAEGQQANVKKVFDGCGFFYDANSWIHIDNLPGKTFGDVDILLFNDQTNHPLTEEQIEAAMKKFVTNVSYFYFGDKRIKSDEYRKTYKIDLDFCNSPTRLESGLLSLLKIR